MYLKIHSVTTHFCKRVTMLYLQCRLVEVFREEIIVNPSFEGRCRTSRIGTNGKTALIPLYQVVLEHDFEND